VAKSKKTVRTETKDGTRDDIAILLDLEGAVLNGRAIAYGLIRDRLGSKKVDVTPVMFSRYCVERRPGRFVPELLKLGGAKDDGSGLAAKIDAELAQALLDKSAVPAPGMEDLLTSAWGKGVRTGLLSRLPNPAMDQVVNKLGMNEKLKGAVSYSDDEKGYPPADAWLKLAKTVAVKPSRCVAFVGSSRACSTALAAHMRCVILPDEFTAFQDFGGADLLLDKPDAGLVDRLIESMAVRQ